MPKACGMIKPLIDLLRSQKPKSLLEARQAEVAAALLAEKLGLEILLRKEGEAPPMGFFLYPPSDRSNIGAMLRRGRRLYGWRWSIRFNRYTSWEFNL